MPLGSTHDRITLWTLPGLALGIGVLTRNAAITLAVTAAYLFSGLMFSGDLDIRSRQYKRWLGLRWIWIPYRRLIRHRSLWSHGPMVGTLLRLIYLSLWILPVTVGILALGARADLWAWQPWFWINEVQAYLQVHGELLLWIGLGLELGSTNHSLSDWTISAWKRWRRKRQKKQPKPAPLKSGRSKGYVKKVRVQNHSPRRSARSYRSAGSTPSRRRR